MKSITIVGCGVMGSRLVEAMMNAGVKPVIVVRHIEAAEPFIARGAKYAPTLQEAEETDCILLNLPHHGIASAVIKACTKERLAYAGSEAVYKALEEPVFASFGRLCVGNEDDLLLCGKIALVLSGAFPMMLFIKKHGARLFSRIERILGIDSATSLARSGGEVYLNHR